MTEWNASDYAKRSAMQKWLADECLSGLELSGAERVLDIGCGDGKITAEIAERVPGGSVIGIDPSLRMVEFAQQRFRDTHANLEFASGDATRLAFRDAFDLVVSFNALHWVHDQKAVLRGIGEALRPGGRTLLQFVSKGDRKSLESVIEDVRQLPRWSKYFPGYAAPFLHLPPEEYRALAEASGLRVEGIETMAKAWDFGSPAAFGDFAKVTFVEWTRMIPPAEHQEFIDEVLRRYRGLGDGSAADAGVFHFYQMKVRLRRD